jgi:hypothetical protein
MGFSDENKMIGPKIINNNSKKKRQPFVHFSLDPIAAPNIK